MCALVRVGSPSTPFVKTVTGRVVGIDDSPSMIDVARKNAPGDHADNLSFEVMDTQHLELDDSSFDNILCSLGLMHIPDPLAASREMRRVAAPGARLAVLIWGVAEENFLGALAEALRNGAGDSLALDYSYVTRLGAPGTLENVLASTGWDDVTTRKLTTSLVVADADQFWTMFTAVGGLFRNLLNELAEADVDRVRPSSCAFPNGSADPRASRSRQPRSSARHSLADVLPWDNDCCAREPAAWHQPNADRGAREGDETCLP